MENSKNSKRPSTSLVENSICNLSLLIYTMSLLIFEVRKLTRLPSADAELHSGGFLNYRGYTEYKAASVAWPTPVPMFV